MKLKDRVAIVTGGGTGIGRATAVIFASEGARVVVAARTLSRLEEVVEEIQSGGGQAEAIQTDISDEKQVQRMVAQTLNDYDQIDILVNNSAVANGALVADMVLDNWNEVLAVNLTGTMLCSREVLKPMIPRKSGSIVNISSVAGIYGVPGLGAYSASKWGVIGFTQTLAIEVGEYNIRVNSISPAATRTDRFVSPQKARADALGVPFEEVMSEILPRYSLKRIADPSEIAAAALFLASDDASAITGHNLVASCGFHAIHP
jgi:3-oxoacyl-[acyl-carrier protein] reductase